MRRIRWAPLLVTCLLLGAACVANAQEPKPVAKGKKKDEIATTLETNERAIWEAIKNHDTAAFLGAVDKQGFSADMNGFATPGEAVEMIKDVEVSTYALHDFKTTMVSKDVYLLTYTANAVQSYKGQPMPPLPTFISTLYVKRGERWLAFFHQETMAPPPQAAGGGDSH